MKAEQYRKALSKDLEDAALAGAVGLSNEYYAALSASVLIDILEKIETLSQIKSSEEKKQ